MDTIEALYEQHRQLREYLLTRKEVSFVSEVERTYPRVLAVAAASYCESEIVRILTEHFGAVANGDELLVEFLKNKAMDRQYHTFFSWKERNVNTFWAMFGPQFKECASELVKRDDELAEAARRFVELGRLRNELVHRDFISVTFDSTADEIIELARHAGLLLTRLPDVLAGYSSHAVAQAGGRKRPDSTEPDPSPSTPATGPRTAASASEQLKPSD